MASSNNNDNVYESAAVRRSLAGESNINAIEAFKQANELTRSSFSTFTLAGMLVLTVIIASIAALSQILGFELTEFNELDATRSAIVDITLVLILSPLMAGLMMMGIAKARNESIVIGDLFKWISLTVVLALGSLLTSILFQLGMVMLILPGIYIGIATTFTLPLIADKRLTAVSALILSVRVVNVYFIQFLLFFVISIGLFLFSAFTFGLALIWIFPLYLNAKGILYNQLFGNDKTDDISDSSSDRDTSVFNA